MLFGLSCNLNLNHPMEKENGKDVYSAGYGESGKFLSSTQLSGSLEKLLLDAEFDYSDAEIVVEGISVGVNRCILASRSPFFHELFKKRHAASGNESKQKYVMTELVPHGKIGYEAFMVFLNYVYTGKLKACPPEVSTCVDDSCAHDACGPAINFAVEVMYASATFQMKELVLVVQCRLLNFVDKAFVEDVIPIVVVALNCKLNQLLSYSVHRIARSDLDDVTIEKELPHEVLTDIRSFRKQSKQDPEHDAGEVKFVYSKRIRRLHKAMDSDDIELLKLLLDESDITLDCAFALHYAAAYCDPKVVSKVLSLGDADLSLRSPRGYTVLHVAARRKDLSVILGFLSKGACVSDSTNDGQTPITICRRLTRPKDYKESTEQGKETNKDRLCIDVLEREMCRNPLAGNMSMSSMMVTDDLLMRLLLLENRVALARVLFPREARLAMKIANAHSTSEFRGLEASKASCGNLREFDLNEIPYKQVKRLQLRLQALQKAVETGRLFFPNCSYVLDRFLEDDIQETVFLEEGPPEKEAVTRMSYVELKVEVIKAFDKDKWENKWPNISNSCSGSSSTKVHVDINVRKRKTKSSIDGEMSTTICRTLTQPTYYCNNVPTYPMAGSISMSSMMLEDDAVMRLLLLENRVSVARALLPSEVKLAMGIADADSYSEFRDFSASNTLYGSLKMINLNENPSEQEKQLQTQLQALRKAVEKGRHFYPSCCEVLDRFLDDDLVNERIKEMRFMEIKVSEAFETDKARIHPTDLSLSSPSETDTILLERARKLLRGNNVFTMGLEEAMMVFNNVDKDRNSGTGSSSSSSSISSVNQIVRKRELC